MQSYDSIGKLFVLGSIIAVLLMAGCTSTEQPSQPISEPVNAQWLDNPSTQRLDVKKTVNALLDYCVDWAGAFEANLGKDPREAFTECVALTSDNMKKQAQQRLGEESQSEQDKRNFPFAKKD